MKMDMQITYIVTMKIIKNTLMCQILKMENTCTNLLGTIFMSKIMI